MLIIGLTGGIASGKSAIACTLKDEPGIAVIEADQVAWETYRPGTPVYEGLVKHFGSRILKPDGAIDRHALGAIIFEDPAERDFVNRLVHPEVRARLKGLAHHYEAQGIELLIVEAALLLEKEPVDQDLFDYYVLVYVDREEQIRRLMERDHISREEALKKIRAQAPQEEKMKRADFVLHSSGDLKQTIQRAKELFAHIRLLPKRRKNL